MTSAGFSDAARVATCAKGHLSGSLQSWTSAPFVMRQPVSPKAMTRVGFGLGRTRACPLTLALRAPEGMAAWQAGSKPLGTGLRSIIGVRFPDPKSGVEGK